MCRSSSSRSFRSRRRRCRRQRRRRQDRRRPSLGSPLFLQRLVRDLTLHPTSEPSLDMPWLFCRRLTDRRTLFAPVPPVLHCFFRSFFSFLFGTTQQKTDRWERVREEARVGCRRHLQSSSVVGRCVLFVVDCCHFIVLGPCHVFFFFSFLFVSLSFPVHFPEFAVRLRYPQTEVPQFFFFQNSISISACSRRSRCRCHRYQNLFFQNLFRVHQLVCL